MSIWPSCHCDTILDMRNGLAIQSRAHSPPVPQMECSPSPSPPRSVKIRIFQSSNPVLPNYDYSDGLLYSVGKTLQGVWILQKELILLQVFLREQLIAELEEKQKMIEAERYSMELTGDSMDLKPITTRKLRRRANESASELDDTYCLLSTVLLGYNVLGQYMYGTVLW